MKKKTGQLSMRTAACCIGLVSLLGSAGLAWATDTGGGSTSTANSGSTAVGYAGASAVSMPFNANLNNNSLQSTLSLQQTFEASRPLPPPVTGLMPGISTPQIFQSPTVPQFGKGVPLALVYYQQCDPVLKGDTNLKEEHERGESGNTDVIFLPHPSYLSSGKEGESVGSVSVSFPKKPEKVNCLGILTVNARKKDADKVTMYGAINDAQAFAKAKLQGFPDIQLLCAQNAVAVNIGMQNHGIAGSLSPGVNIIDGTARGLFSLLGGITGQSARVFPSAQLGLSCIVAAAGGSTTVNLADLNQTLDHMFAHDGNRNVGAKAYGSGTNGNSNSNND